MADRYLNVTCKALPNAEVNITGITRLGGVQDAIKAKLGDDIVAPAGRIQLYDKDNNLITDLDDIHDDYFKKLKDGGLSISIQTASPPSREASSSSLFTNPNSNEPTTKRAKYLSDMREDGVSGTLCLDSDDDVVAKSLTQYLALGKLLENDLCVTKVIAWLNEVHNAK
ncbi:hypothetical protein HK100_006248, partial [Physocladia obscura]